MGRKKKKKPKKKKEDEDIEDDENQFSLNISGEVKRSVVAIFLFALAIIFVLGFLGNAGMLGKSIDKTVGSAFGLGKWLSPIVLIIVGVILLFRKETLFYVSKIIGIVVAFMSVLGFMHLYFEEGKLLEIAKSGEGGGYAGYIISIGLIKFTGVVAGSVILIAFLLIGIIIAFDFSIAKVFPRISLFKPKEKDETEAEESGDEGENEIDEEEAAVEKSSDTKDEEQEEEKESEDGAEKEGNIKNIKFVEGPEENEHDDEGEESLKSKAMGFFSSKKTSDEFSSHPLDQSWKLPPPNLLESSSENAKAGDVEKNAKIIQETLGQFGIEVVMDHIQTGPTVTQYSFRPAIGVKVSRITALNDNLAMALAKHPIRIEAPIPGKSLVGVEVPNKTVAKVRMREIISSENFVDGKSKLKIILGKDVNGNSIIADLKKMPHLLIAGATNTGKSVCINSILMSLLYQNSPSDLKLILVDPKRVELSLYNKIPYLMCNVITERKQVVNALKNMILEMEKRYRLLQDTKSRDISSYNNKIAEGSVKDDNDQEDDEKDPLKKLPYIVIIVDELADIMASHGKEVEGAIIRLSQMARAVGIHLILATQHPNVEILTGLIKANIATRISFRVANNMYSRVILDAGGAEKLIGNGDMLYKSAESSKPQRIQGVYISESEINKVVGFIRKDGMRNWEEEINEDITKPSSSENMKIEDGSVDNDDHDALLYEEAKKIIIEAKKASTSYLQVRLKIGYARAARIMNMLEENGVIGPADGAKPREILVDESSEETEYEESEIDQEKRDKWQM